MMMVSSSAQRGSDILAEPPEIVSRLMDKVDSSGRLIFWGLLEENKIKHTGKKKEERRVKSCKLTAKKHLD